MGNVNLPGGTSFVISVCFEAMVKDFSINERQSYHGSTRSL